MTDVPSASLRAGTAPPRGPSAPLGTGVFAGLARHWAIWREAWKAENARPQRDLKGGEREFLPAAIEIMEHPASPLGRALIWSLCAFFTIAVGWAIVGRIDIVAVAQGKVVPQGRTKVVQPLEIGVVRTIFVQDGDRVTAGQPLLDLDPTDASADHERLERERAARALDVARLDTLLGGGPVERPFVAAGDVDPLLLEAARRLLQAQWQERTAKLASLDGEIERRRAELQGAETDVARFKAIMPLLRIAATARPASPRRPDLRGFRSPAAAHRGRGPDRRPRQAASVERACARPSSSAAS